MNSNTHEPVLNLTNHVLAVIDDGERARDVIRQLDASGILDGHAGALDGVEGVQRIDADGHRGGRILRVLRALQSVTTEGEHLRRYEAELEQGHLVVSVPVRHAWNRRRVVEILRTCGAHFINAYGHWTIESLVA